MPVTLVLPEGIQYVPIVFAASTWVVFWQVGQVAKARAKAKILYPQLYAEKSEAAAAKDALVFNCVQRAHHNTMETLPLVLLSASIIATKYPIVAASLYGAWTLFRIPYTIGYRTGEPSKRNYLKAATMNFLLTAGLLATSTFTVAKSFLG